ncbi:lipopolysaccharide biosynthesis protein [Longitalea luteola]|uniref:lipopolysaccharide biosynthesis protein n=1 Tax=Longitalea luteola TaxID=2812563 RepID=UPI001A968173|nr:oligosaccharide flippase family protein [Longitalea luteola]
MSGIKKLAGQTLWYGVSSIFARFLNYLLTPYLTYKLTGSGYGEMSLVYASIPFLNTIFLFGLDTAYFRYVQKEEYAKNIYNTLSISIFSSTLFLSVVLILFNDSFAHLVSIADHPEYITLSILIIAFDALSALPFAKLRQENRPVKFAMVRVTGILINIAIIYFFLSLCPRLLEQNANSPLLLIYNKDFGVGYVLLANVIQSFYQLIILRKELFAFDLKFDFPVWKEVMLYAMPLAIANFAGMINETFDRIMLGWWAPVQTQEAARFEVGTYSACYKLAILISLFIQAFRMGAEPFFFKQATQDDAPRTYARVMKFFVITVTLMFLVVALYLDVWKHFIQNEAMWEGLTVVPILLFANIFLGIYYNLSIWYKLSQKTSAGAWITLVGALITLGINAAFIPRYSYIACAWATFFCYGCMMAISYLWGQKKYPIPYATKKLCAYMVIVAILYFVHHAITGWWPASWLNFTLATLFTLGYLVFILRVERKEFSRLPYVGKMIYKII